jgi:hypothetical protein
LNYHLKDLSQAFAPDKWRVLGVPLADFCEGHRLLLARVNSPFLRNDTREVTITREDLVRAVLICAGTYEQGCEFIHRDAANRLLFKEKRLAWGTAWQARFDRGYIQRNAEAFAKYQQEADRLPAGIWRTKTEDPKKAKTIHTPAPLLNILELGKQVNLAPSQVLNLPLRAITIIRYGILSLPGDGYEPIIEWGHPDLMQKLAEKEAAANG